MKPVVGYLCATRTSIYPYLCSSPGAFLNCRSVKHSTTAQMNLLIAQGYLMVLRDRCHSPVYTYLAQPSRACVACIPPVVDTTYSRLLGEPKHSPNATKLRQDSLE